MVSHERNEREKEENGRISVTSGISGPYHRVFHRNPEVLDGFREPAEPKEHRIEGVPLSGSENHSPLSLISHLCTRTAIGSYM